MATPNTIVKLYSGIPADPTYQNVLQWDTVEEQAAFFANHAPIVTYTDFLPFDNSRPMRVKLAYEQCYNINYVAYQNHRFGNKWFYAFVTNVEYASPESTNLYLEVDIWATWQFDLTFNKSFVERETVSNDTIGAHTLPENVELGPYETTANMSIAFQYNRYRVYATNGLDDTWQSSFPMGGDSSGGSFNPVIANVPIYNKTYTIAGWSSLVGDLENFATEGKADAVLAIVLECNGPSAQEKFPALKTNYSARNNKLFTFPYVCAVAYAPGQILQMRYEQWPGKEYKLITDGGPNQRFLFTPVNYAGELYNDAYQISVSTTMALPWISDYYQNWSAQNRAQNVMGIVGGVFDIIGGITNAAAGGGGEGISSGVKEIGNVIAASYKAQIMPDVMNGTFENGNINILNGKPSINLMCRAIRPEYASFIEDYFSMFGYKVARVKEIELHSRSNWNFVKTIEANITGECPSTVIERVKAMFDNGVTLWHNGTFNYGTLANPIIS